MLTRRTLRLPFLQLLLVVLCAISTVVAENSYVRKDLDCTSESVLVQETKQCEETCSAADTVSLHQCIPNLNQFACLCIETKQALCFSGCFGSNLDTAMTGGNISQLRECVQRCGIQGSEGFVVGAGASQVVDSSSSLVAILVPLTTFLL